MISVGIDVSKGKSTVCAIKPYGEVLMTPRDFKHTKDELESLTKQLSRFKEEIHIIMEATGNYHLPVYQYLKSKDYQISIVNPLEMKRYRCQGIRNPKTDKIDSMIIAQYGIQTRLNNSALLNFAFIQSLFGILNVRSRCIHKVYTIFQIVNTLY